MHSVGETFFVLALLLSPGTNLGDCFTQMTQTHGIMRYIGRKHDLCGKTDAEKWKLDMLTEQCMDFRNGWVRLCYGTWVSYTTIFKGSYNN